MAKKLSDYTLEELHTKLYEHGIVAALSPEQVVWVYNRGVGELRKFFDGARNTAIVAGRIQEAYEKAHASTAAPPAPQPSAAPAAVASEEEEVNKEEEEKGNGGNGGSKGQNEPKEEKPKKDGDKGKEGGEKGKKDGDKKKGSKAGDFLTAAPFVGTLIILITVAVALIGVRVAVNNGVIPELPSFEGTGVYLELQGRLISIRLASLEPLHVALFVILLILVVSSSLEANARGEWAQDILVPVILTGFNLFVFRAGAVDNFLFQGNVSALWWILLNLIIMVLVSVFPQFDLSPWSWYFQLHGIVGLIYGILGLWSQTLGLTVDARQPVLVGEAAYAVLMGETPEGAIFSLVIYFCFLLSFLLYLSDMWRRKDALSIFVVFGAGLVFFLLRFLGLGLAWRTFWFVFTIFMGLMVVSLGGGSKSSPYWKSPLMKFEWFMGAQLPQPWDVLGASLVGLVLLVMTTGTL
ncbi:hypothetical protein GF360_00185 [candidate division WWE3 bacterium]|nr:hypothetical protein [candidate division WWE3 bacterium]